MIISKMSLRFKLFFLLGLIIFMNLAGPCLTLFYTDQTRLKYSTVVDKDMESLMQAMILEKSLIMQKGFATYYLLTGSVEWLESLKGYHEQFIGTLKDLKKISAQDVGSSRQLLDEIESKYQKYVTGREQVISLYMTGKKDEGTRIHWQIREQFFAIYNLCENYKKIN